MTVRDAPPHDLGWTLRSDGVCSITSCSARAVAAVERSRSGTRPSYWQAYCAEHSRARGVELREDTLVWTADHLQPSRRGNARARRDSNP